MTAIIKKALIPALLAAGVCVSSLAAQDSTRAAAPDSAALRQAGQPGQKADSTLKAVPGADTAAVKKDSLGLERAARVDSGFGAETALDTLGAVEMIDTTGLPGTPEERRARIESRRGEVLEARVIPWDWDQHTNVIEIGLRGPDGKEYSLVRNAEYDSLLRYQGTRLRVKGSVSRDESGFFQMTVSSFVPLDSLAAKGAGVRKP
jgi:hypothetical protein